MKTGGWGRIFLVSTAALVWLKKLLDERVEMAAPCRIGYNGVLARATI